MFGVEVYAAVRRFVFIEGHSRREAARVFGLSRETVLKMCRFSLPPGYTRTAPVAKPKLGALLWVIDTILEADRIGPVKQRHTAKRIFERLRDERGSTIVTSNLPFEDWTSVLGSERLTGALLDRLTHHVSILTMNGDSYRLKQSAGRLRAAGPEQNQATVVDPDTGKFTST